MKLLTYDIGTGPRAGVLDGSDILDATTLLGATNILCDVRGGRVEGGVAIFTSSV